MPSSVKISVIIPVYNVKDYLPQCLQSVVGQTFTDMEIIAVDDGSTDGSTDILAQYARQYPQLRVLTQANQGAAAARKAGVGQVRGETVCFVDADDVLDPYYVEELWRVYQQTGAKVVLAPLVRLSAKDKEKPADLFRAKCLHGAQRVRVFDDFSAVMALCGKLIHRSCLPGLPFPAARTGDDILPSVTLLAASDPVALAPKAAYFYRCRPGSQSQAGQGRFEGLLHGFLQAKELLKEKGLYNDFAPGFEYVCRVCLTSFMEKHGLTPQEEKALWAVRDELQVPGTIFSKRPWKFRFRQQVLNHCLKYGFSYAKIWRFVRSFYGSGARRLK